MGTWDLAKLRVELSMRENSHDIANQNIFKLGRHVEFMNVIMEETISLVDQDSSEISTCYQLKIFWLAISWESLMLSHLSLARSQVPISRTFSCIYKGSAQGSVWTTHPSSYPPGTEEAFTAEKQGQATCFSPSGVSVLSHVFSLFLFSFPFSTILWFFYFAFFLYFLFRISLVIITSSPAVVATMRYIFYPSIPNPNRLHTCQNTLTTSPSWGWTMLLYL